MQETLGYGDLGIATNKSHAAPDSHWLAHQSKFAEMKAPKMVIVRVPALHPFSLQGLEGLEGLKGGCSRYSFLGLVVHVFSTFMKLPCIAYVLFLFWEGTRGQDNSPLGDVSGQKRPDYCNATLQCSTSDVIALHY